MSRRTQKNVGVIGLGIIGRRVADNLRRRGFHVFVWNRTPRPVPNFVGSPAELAELCDFVQIFVSDDEALMQMVQQIKPSLHVQHVIMAHSTVAPHTMRNAAEIVQRRGAQFLDAPFTGSKIPAEKGELVYYVAGDDAAYRRAKPVLEASSKEIIEIGEIGQATTVKIATNMVTAATGAGRGGSFGAGPPFRVGPGETRRGAAREREQLRDAQPEAAEDDRGRLRSAFLGQAHAQGCADRRAHGALVWPHAWRN
jgi:6-phosphogluconate dehydrogenase (decarboxylating)